MFYGNVMLPCSLWWNLVHVDAEVIGREKLVAVIVASQSCRKGSEIESNIKPLEV